MDTPVANIERDGKLVHGTLTFRGVTVRERIPVHVMHWEDERQACYFHGVLMRLQRKLDAHVKPAPHKPNRHERRAAEVTK